MLKKNLLNFEGAKLQINIEKKEKIDIFEEI